jgi:carboxymethylenebutenolidase
MRERFFDVETPSGRMETFVTHPEQNGPFPAVIIYMRVPRRATGR